MLFRHRNKEAVKQERDQRLLNLIYETKASWDHAKETERAVYEANASTELHYRTRLQEQKYLYLYRIARKFKVHGKMNRGVIDR
ncbi:YaaL family protein [Limosilactobacillus sp. Sa3CUN2]|uniref:YaaL family protein n=1 Tax=Limosilactobacillus avistercoris TaxID=2762243 RepID=A0ABR8PEL7_9LACO|nr:YaaL family protein [Limosilactobacillus avistercoris]MBD7895687.1 YaaL family protein [Limosilactobacillus avistercoris]